MKNRRPQVFTYINAVTHPRTLLREWHENWLAAGYDPTVLTDVKTVTNPRIKSHIDRLTRKNTNPQTFLKWFALAHACPDDAFCVFADYSVFNYGFVPDMNEGRLASRGAIVLYAPGSSDVIFAGKQAMFRQCDMFLAYTPVSDERFSDLDVLKHQEHNTPERTVAVDACRSFGDEGWNEAKLVRYADIAGNPKALRDWMPKEKVVAV